ncbi:Flagellar hook protein FlgE [hydrothermal vent metagenome]|uniref:Flagellar hook protein FlgE n=1 Tax=hydrothermal vent metagenome TaxID=652676 RepID=A0A1W1BVZ4_9ZZZZ
MLKSLFSGVSGLQAHQIAMDVESNNIANVNTVGFKYSRANFSDLLSQNKQIATAPQGGLGGKNASQIGLGTQASSMTRIFSQGSIQNSDKNTDIAIQGDGFFVVSPDGGKKYNYTRAGDFKFDANGNFVDNNGYIVQGWLRDSETGKVDSTAPIQNIVIPPGLTTPAKASTQIEIKANLNSGDTVESYSSVYALDAFNIAADLNRDNMLDKNDSLATPQTDYDNLPYNDGDGDPNTNPDRINENTPSHIFQNSNGKIIERGENVGVLVNDRGESYLLQSGDAPDKGQGVWVGFRTAQVTGTNQVASGALNIASGDININGVDVPAITTDAGSSQEDNANAIAGAINSVKDKTDVTAVAVDTDGDGSKDSIQLINDNTKQTKNIDTTISGNGGDSGLTSDDDDAPMKKFRYTDESINAVGWSSDESTYYFKTTEDLRYGMQTLLRNPHSDGNDLINNTNHIGADGSGPRIEVDSQGKFTVYNPDENWDPDNDGNNDAYDLSIGVDSIVDAGTSENIRFTQTIQALSGSLPAGSTGTRQSQTMNVPTHSSSIDIFDSLGTKHTVKIDFRKADYNATTGSTWKVMISVPEPGVINVAGGATGIPENMIEGQVTFNADGSLSTFTPPSITFTANNGSAPNQSINLLVGTSNAFDGITSFDSKSTTSGISQDGYTGGDLIGIRIDQSGTLVGSFSNGRSFGLAQVAMAKFANNEGLSTEGGNLFNQSANSGDPIIGTAATGGRGFIQSSALEASNVDLSRSLTQLIIIQRGYQANGKTITTSDQLLQTLIGLKQ